jgi:hypothetical protein
LRRRGTLLLVEGAAHRLAQSLTWSLMRMLEAMCGRYRGVLTFPGCPNRDAAIALVRDHLGRVAEVRVIDISDQPAAEQARFLGSPTIRVDGRGIEPGAERHQEYVYGCRLYRIGHSLRGLPDEDGLRQALRTAEPRQ